MSTSSRWIVTNDWLAAKLGSPDLVPVDGSFYLPAQKRDAAAEFLSGHIPGAVRFDLDAISDHANPLPNMLPSAEQFSRDVGALGIAETDTIVVYDGTGMFSSPRVWWTFRLFGAENVFVLEGGMPKWKAEGRPLETGASRRSAHAGTVMRNTETSTRRACIRYQTILTGAGANPLETSRSAR